MNSLAFNTSAEGSQLFLELLEYQPDTLRQRFHFIRADMIRVNVADDMAKPSVIIELLAGFL